MKREDLRLYKHNEKNECTGFSVNVGDFEFIFSRMQDAENQRLDLGLPVNPMWCVISLSIPDFPVVFFELPKENMPIVKVCDMGLHKVLAQGRSTIATLDDMCNLINAEMIRGMQDEQ